ncbi:DUF3817 domain-containing protein [Skermania piniformis]|uniref:DUF3817 domain-containing protein n=1 Tax=Skermania pinensis TaxID=39122 RepID=A0ABX8SCW1_9ACTN|nr:DUF3817 domain-containing protein [Skermania piniformis]QXQ14792.1 DUF3817 domain-containing protein [Skermania piniformis]
MTAPSDTASSASPVANPTKVAAALRRYRILAWVTGLWLLVLTTEMVLKYGFGVHTPSWIPVVHGWVYFAYLLVTLDLAVKVRWPALRTLGTLLAGTVPFLSFWVEHQRTRQVRVDFGV